MVAAAIVNGCRSVLPCFLGLVGFGVASCFPESICVRDAMRIPFFPTKGKVAALPVAFLGSVFAKGDEVFWLEFHIGGDVERDYVVNVQICGGSARFTVWIGGDVSCSDFWPLRRSSVDGFAVKVSDQLQWRPHGAAFFSKGFFFRYSRLPYCTEKRLLWRWSGCCGHDVRFFVRAEPVRSPHGRE